MWAMLLTFWTYMLPPSSRLMCVRWVSFSLYIYRILFQKNGAEWGVGIGAIPGPIGIVDQESRVTWKAIEINIHNLAKKIFTCLEDHPIQPSSREDTTDIVIPQILC
jgi:hypothetical protein